MWPRSYLLQHWETTLAARKAQNQPPPISRNPCCLISILCDPGWFFLVSFSFSLPALLLIFLDREVFRMRLPLTAYLCLTHWATAAAEACGAAVIRVKIHNTCAHHIAEMNHTRVKAGKRPSSTSHRAHIKQGYAKGRRLSFLHP